jgi:vitamin B12 transporter
VEYLGAWTASDQLDVQFGGDYTDETSDSDSADVSYDSSIAGGFAQAIWSPVEALAINAALRYDDHSEFGGYTTGRLTGVYTLPTATVLRASLGTGFRPPSHDELFTPYGSVDFDPETSTSADIGVEQVFADGRGSVGGSLFWLDIDDLIEFDLNTFTYVQQSGSSESKGLELAAAFDITDAVTLSGAYTYTDATLSDGSRRDRVPRHDLSVSLDGGYGARFSYGVNLHAVMDYFDNSTRVDSAAFEEDFTVVNAYLDYALTEDVSAYVRAENLFDAQYQTARGFSAADQAFYVGVAGRF